MNKSFDIAERDFGIPKLLEAEFVAADPDELSIMTYLCVLFIELTVRYVSYFRAKKEQLATTKEMTVTASGDGLTVATANTPATFVISVQNAEGEGFFFNLRIFSY